MTRKKWFQTFISYLAVLLISQWLAMFVGQLLFPSLLPTPSSNQLPSAMSLLISISITPLFEEWLFRKKSLLFFNRYVSVSSSVLISSFLFSLIHLQPYVVPYFIAGLIYSSAYLKTGKLMFSVLLHASYNSISIGLFIWEVVLC